MNEQLQSPPNLPERRKINHKLLWLALMGPIALMALLTGLAFAHIKFEFFSTAIPLGLLAIAAGWVLFGITLSKRMPTAGYIICLIAYPIVQAVICFTLFFFGCLTSMEGNWGHSAPDSWVEEQERLARENPIDPVELEEAKRELDEHLKQQEELKEAEEKKAVEKPEHDSPSEEEPLDTMLNEQETGQ